MQRELPGDALLQGKLCLAAVGLGRGSGVRLDGSGCEYWQVRFWK